MSILVSINCITYNHEKYIGDALEGFLNQKTDFEYEIIIGEDCSTDNTREIIRDYMKKHPEKIRLITSEKNVGMANNEKRVYEASRGKYIAECEGDDFWIDPYKLQKQIDYMERNPGCTLCFHNAYKINTKRNIIGTMISKEMDSKELDCGEIAKLGFIPTASRVYLKNAMKNPPYWYETAVVGDLPSQLIITSKGYAHYMKDIMSVYRVGVENSATFNLFYRLNDEERIVKNQEELISILDNFNIYSQFKYSKKIKERKKLYEYQLYFIKGDIKKLKQPKYKEFYKKLGIKAKIGIYVKSFNPKMYKVVNKVYRPIKNIIDQILCQIKYSVFGRKI
ncbi:MULTISPECIES: glycosyltransferase family 2 protein [unclassified Clostridium]|uniref:glycosyltransferase family 2 protein n=1 Tax=unclassified Clostridium TaxID=2614128 RepID=UPI000297A52E|nr:MULTISPECIES: glycosyltransferase family 2 protein [unclassified Clostridium]EKQ56940.1 MAG: glycosyl transferase [Clostridium sp. Maddingley MBC34-26]